MFGGADQIRVPRLPAAAAEIVRVLCDGEPRRVLQHREGIAGAAVQFPHRVKVKAVIGRSIAHLPVGKSPANIAHGVLVKIAALHAAGILRDARIIAREGDAPRGVAGAHRAAAHAADAAAVGAGVVARGDGGDDPGIKAVFHAARAARRDAAGVLPVFHAAAVPAARDRAGVQRGDAADGFVGIVVAGGQAVKLLELRQIGAILDRSAVLPGDAAQIAVQRDALGAGRTVRRDIRRQSIHLQAALHGAVLDQTLIVRCDAADEHGCAVRVFFKLYADLHVLQMQRADRAAAAAEQTRVLNIGGVRLDTQPGDGVPIAVERAGEALDRLPARTVVVKQTAFGKIGVGERDVIDQPEARVRALPHGVQPLNIRNEIRLARRAVAAQKIVRRRHRQSQQHHERQKDKNPHPFHPSHPVFSAFPQILHIIYHIIQKFAGNAIHRRADCVGKRALCA